MHPESCRNHAFPSLKYHYGYCLPCPNGIPIPDIFRFQGYYERCGMKQSAVEQYRLLPTKAAAWFACEECIPVAPTEWPSRNTSRKPTKFWEFLGSKE